MTPLERLHGSYDVMPDGCWRWKHWLRRGYGQFTLDGIRLQAHRASYLLLVGPIPEGLDLDHTCHTNDRSCPGGDTCPHRSCVNPAHLEPVTRSVNLTRGHVGLWNRETTHCPQNHPYDDMNTYTDRRGWRGCRQCRREASRNFKARKKAAA